MPQPFSGLGKFQRPSYMSELDFYQVYLMSWSSENRPDIIFYSLLVFLSIIFAIITQSSWIFSNKSYTQDVWYCKHLFRGLWGPKPAGRWRNSSFQTPPPFSNPAEGIVCNFVSTNESETGHWTSQRHPSLPNFCSDHGWWPYQAYFGLADPPEPMGFEPETLWVTGYEGVNP